MPAGLPAPGAEAPPELPLAPAELACDPDDELDGIDGMEDDDEDDGIDGMDDDDEEDDDGMDGMDEELLDGEDDDDEGICGILEDCCDCCVDSHALSSSAETLRLNRIRVRGIFMITDSNRRSQCFEFTVIKTGSRHHYCASELVLSIS